MGPAAGVRSKIVAVESRAGFAETAAAILAEEIRAAIEAHGRCALALAGGSTPRETYARLAATTHVGRFPWSAVDFYFGDERCVPLDDPESNYRMARDTLFDPLRIPAERIHRIEGERMDPRSAAAEYERLLPDRLDLLLLGIGEDGHTASLFPGSPALDERALRVLAVEAPKPPPRRVTITPPVLESARRILVLASGASKAEAVARALEGPLDPKRTPAQLARRGLWILDRAARL